jgi:type II secretory pathway pseudopilin PulG
MKLPIQALWRLLCAGIVVGILSALLLPGILQVRETVRRTDCRANLQQISQALHAYHEHFGSFPPAYVRGPENEKWHSWRVLILPYLGEHELARDYHFDEPWDGPRNRQLIGRMPAVFGCPSADRTAVGVTTYLAVVGPTAAWPEYRPLALNEIFDGASNTIQIVDWAGSNVVWTQPDDLPYAVLTSLQAVDGTLPWKTKHDEGLNVLMADGTARNISPRISPKVFREILSPSHGLPARGVSWPRELLAFESPLPEARPAEDFRQTDLIPHPRGPIVSGRNYVYCGTFELAWGELREIFGGEPVQLDGDPPVARELNTPSFRRDSLSPRAFVARAGMLKDGIIPAIRDEMAQKFPDARPEFLGIPDDPAQLVAYAYLQKSLPFASKFDSLPQALRFHDAAGESIVKSFGVERYANNRDLNSPREQLTVIDYISDNNFVLRLATTAADDIVLAKIPPAATLEQTIAAVQKRVAVTRRAPRLEPMTVDDRLAVPKLAVGISGSFPELLGRHLKNPGWEDYFLSRALQLIRFRLDESGAKLVSEALVVGENGHEPPRSKERNFVFDRPFLIYLIEPDAARPYFAAWIENAELMEPAR